MREIKITARSPEMFEKIIGRERTARFTAGLESARRRLNGRTVWQVNSTAAGGGVAEMLQSILSYPRGAEIDVRWLVTDGNDEFFEVTKRIHNLLHGYVGDGGPLGEPERKTYEETLRPELHSLLELAAPGDVALLHDPQTLGLAAPLSNAGLHVIWACHIGADNANAATRAAWGFLQRYVERTDAQVFSRAEYCWENLDHTRVAVIPPCIDAFAPKNQELATNQTSAILNAAGILPGTSTAAAPTFSRHDGTTASVTRRVTLIEVEPIPQDALIVCQISRWDPLKDHEGTMKAFAQYMPDALDAHLVLAGPSPAAVVDDPEGSQTFEALIDAWRALPEEKRSRVHVCCVPMDDLDENAIIINALQRRSNVIVQKSLAEGFGLTIAEAMWKGRPTLGSRVGGIQDQIEANAGKLIDPNDGKGFADAVVDLLRDPNESARFGDAARQRVLDEYLPPTYLSRQFALIEAVLEAGTNEPIAVNR